MQIVSKHKVLKINSFWNGDKINKYIKSEHLEKWIVKI